MKATDGTIVAGALTYDAATKVACSPTAILDGGKHIWVISNVQRYCREQNGTNRSACPHKVLPQRTQQGGAPGHGEANPEKGCWLNSGNYPE